jgi:membrane associated rhomboid family serine protease
MVFPIGDDETGDASTPFVTYALILINIAVFGLELSQGEPFIKQWAFIPKEFFAAPVSEAATILTSMFMHGGWMHLIGNMVYLWTFGDNVEDNFGHVPFIIFYLLSGIAAMAAQAFLIPGSSVPNLGASGAIAGVLGAYVVMFPGGRVRLLTQAGIILVPSIIAIGFWIGLQLLSFAGELGKSGEQGGVAYMAHIGGFFVGMALTLFFRNRSQPRIGV